MGRPSRRAERRNEIARAFVRVLGTHGRGGATIAAVAAEAGVAPGLVHHHFADKQDLLGAALDVLLSGFRQRVANAPEIDGLDAYVDAALALDERSDVAAARAWVGVFAEALEDPVLFDKLRRMIDAEIAHLERRSDGALDVRGASAVLTFVVGALVFGSFAPRKTAGFAAPALRRMARALRSP